MSAQDCIFCKIAAGTIPSAKVLETDDVFAFLDIGPIAEGHTLIIPKKHYERMEDCPPQTLAAIGGVLGKVAKAVVEATQADGYNVLCNRGRAAGQVVEHVHFHVVPRKNGDGVFNRWPAGKYNAGRADEILKMIREKLG
jgi:histidine triad (HIT) family protein